MSADFFVIVEASLYNGYLRKIGVLRASTAKNQPIPPQNYGTDRIPKKLPVPICCAGRSLQGALYRKQKRATCSPAARALEQRGEGLPGQETGEEPSGPGERLQGLSLVGSQDRKDRTTTTLPDHGANQPHDNRPITIQPVSSIRENCRVLLSRYRLRLFFKGGNMLRAR